MSAATLIWGIHPWQRCLVSAARTSHQRAAYATEPIWIETSVNVLAQGARKYLRKRDRAYLPAKKIGERRDVLIHHATELF